MTYAAPAWGFISKTNMKQLQVIRNKELQLIEWYDKYTWIEKQNFYVKEIYIKVLALKLYVSVKASRNWYIQKLCSDSLIDNWRVPKPSHIL